MPTTEILGRAKPIQNQIDDRGSRGHRVLAAARGAWSRYWARRAARATAGILQRLDDRTLKDIGLDRTEIDSVARDNCERRRRGFPERRVCAC